MDYFLTGIAGVSILFLVILLIKNRKQGLKIKKNIQEIKKLKTGSGEYSEFM